MDTFILILHSKRIQIPSNFLLLKDIDQDIYQTLITNHQYEIKSNVSESVLESFIDNWINQSIPKINLTNFYQYEELSHEFDRMKSIIELYQINIQKQIISKFKKKVQLLMKRIQNLNNLLHQQINHYQKTIKFLLSDTNYGNIISNTSYKKILFKKIISKNTHFFNLKELFLIEINGLFFNLDKIEKTASVYSVDPNVKSIFIPRSFFYEHTEYLVIEICKNAFSYSDDLETITFSDISEVQTIGESAFENSSINSLEIPSSVVELEKEWCSTTHNLFCISITPNNKRYIYYNNGLILGKSDQSNHIYDTLVFARRDIRKVIIPSFIKKIDPFAFEFCESIEKVEFSKSSELQIIDKFAFSSSSIKSIIIPNHVTKIKSLAFFSCQFLEKIQFQEDSELQIIGSSVFETDPINDIVIPSQVRKIKNCAFANCYLLDNVEFEENSKLESIEINAFAFTPIEFISIPSEFVELKNGWCRDTFALDNVLLNPDNKRYAYFDQYLVGKSDLNSEIFDVLVFAPRNIRHAKIPSFIKIIGQFAFDRCNYIHDVDFSDNNQIELIDNSAFSCSSIEKVIIPDTVKCIGRRAFSDCKYLEYVIFSNNSKLEKISYAAFFFSTLTCIEIPPNVTEIANESLSMCGELQIIEISEDSKLSSFNGKVFNDDIYKILMVPAKLRNTLKII